MMPTWQSMGSWGSLMFIWAMLQQFIPYRFFRRFFEKYTRKIESYFDPYIQIRFDEYCFNDALSVRERSTAYVAIQHYLETNSSRKARRLKANPVKNSQTLVLSMDDYEEITDEYQGITVWWTSMKTVKSTLGDDKKEQQRYYTLNFHGRYRDLITKSYMQHVLTQGKAISVEKRERKLFTNKKKKSHSTHQRWMDVVFEHPATFKTLALDPELKKDIMNDLISFTKAKDYYAKVGKAWKRGYLLYGPPGTGKSTMVAAMADLLQYDVYDLELTSVEDNTELKKLLLETSGKSIIVIEDIDCSLDLTGQRKKNTRKDGEDPVKKATAKEKGYDKSKVTLSGLLNFIDGLWSACAGERIIVFTTNYVENLDPALIRRGRMDKHIKLSYCSFGAFKVLAKNYLDVESHELFGRIEELLAETDITPADVAENLMPKSAEDDSESCLKCLISVLQDAKEAKKEEELKAKAKEEEQLLAKAKEEEQLKELLAKAKEEEELLAKAKEEEQLKELLAKAKEEEQLKAKKEKVQDNGRRFISSKRCCFL